MQRDAQQASGRMVRYRRPTKATAKATATPKAAAVMPGRRWVERLEPRALMSVSLVKDINPGSGSYESTAGQTVDVNGTAFFTVDGQVWKSDGTPAGTVPVSPAGIGADSLTPAGGALYFAANNGTGIELWRTDGTTAGTGLVRDVNPGGASANPRFLTAVGGSVFFVANEPNTGTELWRSDGTAAGTVLVRDVAAGAASSDPRSLCNVNGTLFYVADDKTHGYELWKSDGTTGGTVMVRDVFTGPGTSGVGNLVNVNGTLFFAANAGAGGYEVWKSDGTAAGTTRVKDINPGPDGSSPALLTNVNGTLYFSAYDGVHGDELWKSDGTEVGTVLVKDLTPGAGGSGLELMTAAGGRLYFRMYTPATGTELWTSDGTAGGTGMVRDISPGGPASSPAGFTPVGPAAGGVVYFTANDGAHGIELWRTDGTAGGTVRVAGLVPGGLGSGPSGLAAVGGSVYFAATDSAGSGLFRLAVNGGTAAVAVWRSDHHTYPLGSNPSSAFTYNGAVYFSADDGVHGAELWKTDGSADGTALLKDIVPGPYGSSPSQFVAAGGLLWFVANGQLWRTDGSAAGTVVASTDLFLPEQLAPYGNGICFAANDGPHGQELWRADVNGAVRLSDANPGINWSRIAQVTSAGSAIYFVANDGSTGDELWRSDGTPGGTSLVRDVAPGPVSSGPWFLTPVGNTVFFRASDGGGAGWELWKSDGTAAGTVLVKDVNPGPADSWLGGFAALNGALYFTATDGPHGIELWRSDGTAAGTAMVKDVWAGSHGSSPGNLLAFNGAVYFRADDGVGGQELWRTDGTAAGTVQAVDLRPGPGASTPHTYSVIDGRLAFYANNGSGDRLYLSDGTPAGTTFALAGDFGWWIVPGAPAYLNGGLYFAAYLDAAGTELWKADATAGASAPSALVAAPTSPAAVSTAQPSAAPAGASRTAKPTPGGRPDGLVLKAVAKPAAKSAAKSAAKPGSKPAAAAKPAGPTLPTTKSNAPTLPPMPASHLLAGGVPAVVPAGPPGAGSTGWVGSAAPGNSSTSAPSDGAAAGPSALAGGTPLPSDLSRAASPGAALSLVPAGGGPAALGADPAPTAAVLNSLLYLNPPDLTGFGMGKTLVTLYNLFPGDFPFTDRQAPDETAVRALARFFDQGYTTIVPDIEEWPIDVRFSSDGLVQVYLERYIQIVDWMHDERPAVKVGHYGIGPLFETHAPYGGPPELTVQWQAANARLAPLARASDVVFPSLYTFFEDRNFWKVVADANLLEAKKYGKPVATFLQPSLPADFWRMELETARSGGDSAVLWSGLYQWDDNAAWWSVTRDFVDQANGHPPPAAPAVVQASAGPPAAGTIRLTVSFNKDVRPPAAGDLTLAPAAGGLAVTASAVDYDPAARTATFQVSAAGLSGGTYRATLPAAAVADAGLTPMAADFTYDLTVNAPAVRAAVNDGSAQRSMVRSLTVTFAAAVVLDPGAVTVVGRNGAGAGTVVTAANPTGDGRTYVLTFAGPGVVGGSLPDGVYDLTVAGAKVRLAADPATPLGPAADFGLAFHRLFTDVDGDGDSDNFDLLQLRPTYLKPSTDPAYSWWFDYDASGTVDNLDVFQVRSRRSITFQAP